MSQITYLEGDALYPVHKGNKIIAHITNNQGGWGAGFTGAISRKWKEPERLYRNMEARPLGENLLLQVESQTFICNMTAQNGYWDHGRVPAVDYSALQQCLESLARHLVQFKPQVFTIHMPRIGCGLAGGSWDRIEPLIEDTLVKAGIEVFVYDLHGTKQ